MTIVFEAKERVTLVNRLAFAINCLYAPLLIMQNFLLKSSVFFQIFHQSKNDSILSHSLKKYDSNEDVNFLLFPKIRKVFKIKSKKIHFLILVIYFRQLDEIKSFFN